LVNHCTINGSGATEVNGKGMPQALVESVALQIAHKGGFMTA